MKVKEQMKKYRGMKDSELTSELKDMEKELALANLKVKVGKLEDISSVNKMKKNIARVKTIASERMYGEAENE